MFYTIQYKIKNKGFSLVEVIIALTLFAILAAGVFDVVTNSYRNFYGTGDKQSIAEYAQEAIEVVRSIRDNSWQTIENAATAGGNNGLTKNVSGYWEFSGISNTFGELTRTVAISDVQRDDSDNIVASDGTNDPNTKKVIVTVSGSGIDDYVLTTYITNWSYKTWEQSDWSGIGDREFWSSLTMASSSYSNISTSTLGELALSQSSAPGAIFGDWVNFTPSVAYSMAAWRPVYDMAESPDGNTLYVIGNTNTDIYAFDITHIREGIFDFLWTAPMDMSLYSIIIHPNGKYAYVGSATTTPGYMDKFVEVIDLSDGSIIDTETTDDPPDSGGLRVMDFAINEAQDKLFAVGAHGDFHPYTISDNGATLTSDIEGGGGDGNIIGVSWSLWGNGVQRIWIDESGANDYAYVSCDYATYPFQKFDITDPSNISSLYSYGGSADYNDFASIGNDGSGNTFAVSTEESASELKIIRDNGSSFDLLDSADPGTFHSASSGLIYDGDDTVVLFDTTGLDMVAYDVSDPENIVQVIAPDTSTFGVSQTTWPHHYVEYHEKLGGFFLSDWVANGSVAPLNFVARPETRNIGTGYDYKRTITIDSGSTKVIGGPHSNFPFLFSETQDYLKTVTNGGKVTHDYGYDIIFTDDAAGTNILDYEIERYSSSTGEFIAWVEVPTLATNTDIYMFYGNSNIVTTQERMLGTWDSNYKFVSHMNNRHSYSSYLYPKDSTSYRNHLPSYGNAVQSDGKIGYDFAFDGSWDYIYGAHDEDLDFSTAYTFSTWVRIDGTSASTLNGLFGKSSAFRWFANNDNPAYLRMQMYEDSGTHTLDTNFTGFFTHGEWTKVDVTFDKPDITIFKNGQEFANYEWDYDIKNLTSGTFIAGSIQSNMYWLNGHIDEIQLENIARSPGWIETSYNNQSSPSTFYSIGNEALAGGYNTPGSLYSSILDLGSTGKELSGITVEQNVPSGCSLQITAEVSNDATFTAANVISEIYDDASTSYYSSSTDAGMNGKRYLRYKVDMTACNDNTETPTLYGAKFNYK